MGQKTSSVTNLLFRQKPGAVRKLSQWMEEWREDRGGTIPCLFKTGTTGRSVSLLYILLVLGDVQLCLRSTPPPDEGDEGSLRLPPVQSIPSHDKPWELLPLT